MTRWFCTALLMSGVATQPAPATTSFGFGGRGLDIATAVAVDAQNNIFVAGTTTSPDLPGTGEAFQKQLRGTDAFLAKFDSTGRLLWSTYLGGNDGRTSSSRFGVTGDTPKAIAVDPSGNVYLAGSTGSTDFPTVNAFQGMPQVSSGADAFLVKFDPMGRRLLYSTYLGGFDGTSSVEGLAVGPSGETWVAIRTTARQFPATRDLSIGGAGQVVVARFSPSGTPVWLTRVGYGEEVVYGVAVDPIGQPAVAAYSPRSPCPRTASAPGSCAGPYVTKLDVSGSQVRSTWSLNGVPASNVPGDITVTPGGNVVVAGRGPSGGLAGAMLPIVNAWQAEPASGENGFVAELNLNGVPEMVSYLAGVSSYRVRAEADLRGRLHFAFDTIGVESGVPGEPPPPHPDGPIFTSRDRGESWTWSSKGLRSGVSALAVDGERNIVYAAVGIAAYRSDDDGESWSFWNALDTGPAGAATMALDPREPTTMYGGASNLFRFDQDGRVRTPLRSGGAGVGGFRVGALAVSPHDGSVWVASGNGLEVSTDRGVTWSHRDRGFRTTAVQTIDSPKVIVFDPRQAGVVYVALSEGIYRTIDDGVSWHDFTGNLTDNGYPDRPFVRSLAIDPSDSNRLFAGTSNRGMIMTADGGQTWTRSLLFTSVTAVAASPVAVYASVRDSASGNARLLVTRDDGRSWLNASGGASREAASSLLVHPRDPRRLYAATSFLRSAAYLLRVDESGASRYTPSLASFISKGQVADLTTTLDGQTVLALNSGTGSSEIVVLRIAR
jgi:photosystem II stability/assembly factor-like uncharacterized protein